MRDYVFEHREREKQLLFLGDNNETRALSLTFEIFYLFFLTVLTITMMCDARAIQDR